MLETPAVVRGARTGYVTVEPDALSGCEACAPRGCATKRLARLFSTQPRQFEIRSAEHFVSGQRVIVTVAETAFLAASFRAYIIPLLFILGGAMLAGLVIAPAHGDLAAVLGAAAGLAFGAVLARRSAARIHTTVRLATADSKAIPLADRRDATS